MSNYADADRQKRAILSYWRAQGKEPRVWTETVHVARAASPVQELHYCVRSDMVNGQPREYGGLGR